MSKLERSARLFANRANARKSTGPRTSSGKLRASRNALRHGLAAANVNQEPIDDELQLFVSMLIRATLPNAVELAPTACAVAEAEKSLDRLHRAKQSCIASAANSDGEIAFEQLIALIDEIIRIDRYQQRAMRRRASAVRQFLLAVERSRGRRPFS